MMVWGGMGRKEMCRHSESDRNLKGTNKKQRDIEENEKEEIYTFL